MRDICMEAGIVAEWSMNGVFEGKKYNRAVRVHKCIYGALVRLVYAEFIVWVDNIANKSDVIKSFVEQVENMIDDLNQQSSDDIIQSSPLDDPMILWSDFLAHLHHNNGELS